MATDRIVVNIGMLKCSAIVFVEAYCNGTYLTNRNQKYLHVLKPVENHFVKVTVAEHVNNSF